MALYFSTRNIPGLQARPLPERMALLEAAGKRMTVPEKTLLNVLKLLIIVPVFALVLRTATDWTSLLWAFLIFLLYPLLVKPLQYSICAKHLRLPDTTSEEKQ
ncbi:DUF6170 family protein [Alteromonas lipotrueiana]|uniref:DUF6170 family protein n=1 Tax=Alteromonas lipotrueiana TaxID=2803815 RepID=UPI001C489E88|nr:DUF6170 family protein [Alteromonas lipotrueiana]|tara:strand:+ start:749 stop:1057 length:309 start_codon:yes stop_codon:yes gene_type:complete